MLAKGFVVNGCGDFGVGLGKGKSHAVGHMRILWHLRSAWTVEEENELQAVELSGLPGLPVQTLLRYRCDMTSLAINQKDNESNWARSPIGVQEDIPR